MNDISAPSASTGSEVRGLIRARPVATLASQLAGSGWPYASLVLVATAIDGAPLLLLSRLAEHTKNIAGDARVSLLFDGTEEAPSRLAGARATVLGRANRSDDKGELARFLARHPEAETYAAFADFGLFRLHVDRAHLVAGFGRIHWVDECDIVLPTPAVAAFAAAEEKVLAALNSDVALIKAINAARGGSEWSITGLDPEGCDLRAGRETARVPFASPLTSTQDAGRALAAALSKAR